MNLTPILLPYERVALLVGSGALPPLVCSALSKVARVFVLHLDGEKTHRTESQNDTDAFQSAYMQHALPIGKVGACIKWLRFHNIQHVMCLGYIQRPKGFACLQLDWQGFKLWRLLKQKDRGDNALLSAIDHAFCQHGIAVLSLEDISEVFDPSLLSLGVVGVLAGPSLTHHQEQDLILGRQVLNALSVFDIAQSAIVCNQRVLGIEDITGTDHLIERIGMYNTTHHKNNTPMLIKQPKIAQHKGFDTPSLGVRTMENAARHGIKAIAFQAGVTILIQAQEMIDRANAYGISLVGY